MLLQSDVILNKYYRMQINWRSNLLSGCLGFILKKIILKLLFLRDTTNCLLSFLEKKNSFKYLNINKIGRWQV